MNNSLLTGLNLEDGVCYLIVGLFLVVCCVSVFFLILGIKRDRSRLIAEKYKIKQFDRLGFEDMLTRKYETAKFDTHFTVMLVQINGLDELKATLGERQVKKITLTLRDRILTVIPQGSRVCDYDDIRLAIYIEEHMDNKGVANIALSIITECNRPIVLLTRTKMTINVNIGIASNNEFCPDTKTILQNAELATVNSTKNGYNKYEIYSEQLAETQTEEYRQYQEIKLAIKNHQFTLYYQPIVELGTGKITAYETLVRWEHPTLGLLTPGKFLPIMEQTGDINWVGTWAFEEMLKMQTKHYKENPQDQNIIFTLNLSPKQLMYSHLAEEFRKVYKRYKIPAQNICMEIVEFAMFDKVAEVKSNILKLTQMGFKIAIDDFGLEMSSLKMLEGLEFNWVKLDRKFIEQAQDDFLIGGLVETLVNFAEHKKFAIVAEGVEDEVIERYVKSMSIGYGQGYYYGKPLPPENYNL
ncbi:MAG: EAL domain-containing protein [Candidatus Coproplasma sp.]